MCPVGCLGFPRLDQNVGMGLLSALFTACEVGGAGEILENNMFFRATYAPASRENLIEAPRRFGEALRDEFQ